MAIFFPILVYLPIYGAVKGGIADIKFMYCALSVSRGQTQDNIAHSKNTGRLQHDLHSMGWDRHMTVGKVPTVYPVIG